MPDLESEEYSVGRRIQCTAPVRRRFLSGTAAVRNRLHPAVVLDARHAALEEAARLVVVVERRERTGEIAFDHGHLGMIGRLRLAPERNGVPKMRLRSSGTTGVDQCAPKIDMGVGQAGQSLRRRILFNSRERRFKNGDRLVAITECVQHALANCARK